MWARHEWKRNQEWPRAVVQKETEGMIRESYVCDGLTANCGEHAGSIGWVVCGGGHDASGGRNGRDGVEDRGGSARHWARPPLVGSKRPRAAVCNVRSPGSFRCSACSYG